MTEILFKSACPAEGCNDDKTYYWYHASCPSSSDQVMNIYLIKQRFGVHIVEKFGIFSLQDLNALKVIIK